MNLLDLARSALPAAAISSTTHPPRVVAVTQRRADAPAASPGAAAHPHAVVEYRLTDSKGGTLIDPDGVVSAVNELHWRFGDRVDWQALLAMFKAREHQADREAVALIRRIMADASATRGD